MTWQQFDSHTSLLTLLVKLFNWPALLTSLTSINKIMIAYLMSFSSTLGIKLTSFTDIFNQYNQYNNNIPRCLSDLQTPGLLLIILLNWRAWRHLLTRTNSIHNTISRNIDTTTGIITLTVSDSWLIPVSSLPEIGIIILLVTG